MLLAALFMKAEHWKQPKYPDNNGMINEMWHIHTLKYYRVMKKNKLWLQSTCT